MKKMFFLVAAARVSLTARAQAPKESVAILDFDTRSYPVDVQQVLQKATIEMMRINQYEVIDKYDIEYIAKRDTLPISLMPEGLLQAFTPEQQRDLLAYLMGNSQVPLAK